MLGYLGSYLHQIDDKGRLSLPAAFRRESADSSLVLVKVQPDALTLYPPDTWQDIQQRMLSVLRRDAKQRHKILQITASATEVAPDKQGRIPIPPRLREAVGIDGAALVVGALDRIEIWDPDRFEATVGTAEDEENLIGQIFA